MVCLAAACIAYAAEAQGHRPIEISAPRGQSIETNVNQLRLSGLKSIEADISKPFQSLSPRSSLDGIMAPQVLPQPQSASPQLTQRERELRDRRKNWAFANPDEFGSDLSPEKMFGLKQYDANGVEKKNSTAMERFADRLNSSATNRFSMDSDATNSFSGDAMSDGNRQANSVFATVNPATAVFKPPVQASPFSDIFNTSDSRMTDDALREQKAQQAHADTFRQLWNYDQGSSGNASGFQTPVYTPIGETPSPAKTFQPVLGTITPTATAPVQSSLTPQVPAPAPARTTTFTPDFTAPQRRF